MVDILDGTLKNCALCLLTRTVRYYAAKFVDSFVDITSASALDFFLRSLRERQYG
jgi:hypothetical protein